MRTVACAIRNQIFPFLVAPFAPPNSFRQLELMCVRVRVEPHRRLARLQPLPGGLGRFGSMEGIPAADVARVRVFIMHDGVPCRILGLVAAAD